MPLNVLVTGAAGCVGRRLCRTLLDRGYGVTAVVRSAASQSRLPAQVRIARIDEIGPQTIWPSEIFAGVDAVIHLAAKVHQPRGGDTSPTYHEVNTEGTLTLARALARLPDMPRFVFCSSAHAVGNFCESVLDESSPCRPQTPYGRSKFDAEVSLRDFSAKSGLPTVIVRPPAVYGPELPGDLMRLLRLVSRGVPLPLGAIEARRSLVYVDNLVDALIVAARHPEASGQTYFVSDGEGVALNNLLRMFAVASGRRPRLISIAPARLRTALKLFGRGDAVDRLMQSLTVDSTRIQRTLAWRPPFALADGLAATAQWLKRAA